MYDALSQDYDRFVNWPGRLAVELPFIERLIRPLSERTGRPARVLDDACGTGMHAIALAERGFETAGADLSAAMIERARANAEAAGVRVRFEPAGFGGLAATFGAGAFDAVLCLGNSLPHLLSAQAVSEALSDFAACLRSGGLLLVQNRNFDAVLAAQARWMEPQSFQEGEGEWLFLRFYDFLPDGLIRFNILTLTRSGNEAWRQHAGATLLRPQTRAELAGALSQAGFSDVTAYGDLQGSPFDPQASGNLVLVGRSVG